MLDNDGNIVAEVDDQYNRIPNVLFSDTTLWKYELQEISFKDVIIDPRDSWYVSQTLRTDNGQRIWKLTLFLNIKV